LHSQLGREQQSYIGLFLDPVCTAWEIGRVLRSAVRVVFKDSHLTNVLHLAGLAR